MNTKSLPAVIALAAGFVTCIMSFVQGVDTVVFAKRFILVCLIFYVIGTVASVIIQMNFKSMKDDGDKTSEETDEEFHSQEDGTEEQDETE